MAGIAATLRADRSTLGALSAALAVRGADAASRQLGLMSLLVRAAIPVVHAGPTTALVVDGIAEASTLAARYAEQGPAGLVAGPDPYALILADTERDTLVAARNGDGPPLYWARLAAGEDATVLVASEPAALLAAGVPAEPDRAAIERFLATGACDDTAQTFFAGIRRVLAGQVVEIDDRGVRTQQVRTVPSGLASAEGALRAAAGSGRIGVRLGPGVAGAAVLGAALTRSDRPRPLSVYSATFPGLPSTNTELAAAVLGGLPVGAVRHRAKPFFVDELDFDAFLADVGEPVPDLTGYLLWATAKLTAGEVDALLDATGAGVLLAGATPAGPARRQAATGYLSRLADRMATRFGVALRFPYRDVIGAGEVLRAELTELVERGLPAGAARQATGAPAALVAGEPPLREVLARMPEALAETFLSREYAGRPWAQQRATLAAFQAMLAGRRADAELLFRRYLVERWLRMILPAAAGPPPVAPVAAVVADAAPWARFPIRTDTLLPGVRVAEKLGFYVCEFVPVLAADKVYRDALHRPWYLLIAAKPVAIAQGRLRQLWQVRPRLTARLTARLFGPASGLATPWAAQVAVDESGALRTVLGAACAALGRPGWYERLAPAAMAVRGPRQDALPPGRVAVISGPASPSRVAAEVLAVLRTGLPAQVYPALAGVAVVAAGGRLVGWAPGTAGQPAPVGFIAEVAAGDPFGNADERTPLLIAVAEPARSERPAAGSKRAKPRAAGKRSHAAGGVASRR